MIFPAQPQNPEQKQPKSSMQISDILSVDRVTCNINIASKKAALEALSGLLAGANSNLTQAEAFHSLLTRERLGDTGLGNGIALPHGRLKDRNFTVAAFIRLAKGIDYDALDQQPVDLMFALLVPENSTDEHLQILAKLAEMFSKPELLAQLREEDSNDTIYDLLTS